jgi:hypothetical protein
VSHGRTKGVNTFSSISLLYGMGVILATHHVFFEPSRKSGSSQ